MTTHPMTPPLPASASRAGEGTRHAHKCEKGLLMTEITSMEQLGELVRAGEADFKQYGEVNAIWYDDPLDLVLFNYTQAAQWKPVHEWNWFERNSRGLILDGTTGEIVARPFRKFFNYGQDEPAPDAKIADITEKMDGSLGILLHRKGEWYVATRGSLFSDQAQWATAWWRQHVTIPSDFEGITLLFEIIYPGNRIVVNYGDYEGLVLIGVVRNRDGVTGTYRYLTEIAERLNLRTPRTFDFTDWQQMIDAAAVLSVNDEGWVVRMSDDERYKIKGSAYKVAHRIMTGVTFSRVLEAVTAGDFERMIEGVPDEFLGHVRAWQDEIEDTVKEITRDVLDFNSNSPFPILDRSLRESRKDYALWMQRDVPKHLHGYMWANYDGKDLRPLILKGAFKDRPNSNYVAIVEEG